MATGEFEVTADRLGVYRAEEHIDNPLGYGGDEDASKLDPRLRGPVRPIETEIDMRTGMKNYIANESGDWATSAGYLRFSLARCIHFGRLYTCGETGKGKEENLCEALRCLGQLLVSQPPRPPNSFTLRDPRPKQRLISILLTLLSIRSRIGAPILIIQSFV